MFVFFLVVPSFVLTEGIEYHRVPMESGLCFSDTLYLCLCTQHL